MKETHVSIIFLIISGSSLRTKFSKVFTFISSFRLGFRYIFRGGKFAITAFKENYMYDSDIKNKLSEVPYSVNTLCIEHYLINVGSIFNV